jgi:hypothetical protein
MLQIRDSIMTYLQAVRHLCCSTGWKGLEDFCRAGWDAARGIGCPSLCQEARPVVGGRDCSLGRGDSRMNTFMEVVQVKVFKAAPYHVTSCIL